MIDWRNLIATSRLLINAPGPTGQPLEESLRRAVSTAYYAMFHALSASNADSLIGISGNPATNTAWVATYRGIDHRAARRNLQRDPTRFSLATQNFIEIFARIQDARHGADYDPYETITLQQATKWIDTAEEAIEGFLGVPADERKAVAVRALIRERSN